MSTRKRTSSQVDGAAVQPPHHAPHGQASQQRPVHADDNMHVYEDGQQQQQHQGQQQQQQYAHHAANGEAEQTVAQMFEVHGLEPDQVKEGIRTRVKNLINTFNALGFLLGYEAEDKVHLNPDVVLNKLVELRGQLIEKDFLLGRMMLPMAPYVNSGTEGLFAYVRDSKTKKLPLLGFVLPDWNLQSVLHFSYANQGRIKPYKGQLLKYYGMTRCYNVVFNSILSHLQESGEVLLPGDFNKLRVLCEQLWKTPAMQEFKSYSIWDQSLSRSTFIPLFDKNGFEEFWSHIQSYWHGPWNSAQQGVNVAALTTVKTKHTTSDEQIIRLV